MFDTSLKISGALLLAAALASCETAGLFPKPGEAYVKEVAVTAAPSTHNPVPPGLEGRLHSTLVSDAARAPQTGAPKRISIVVNDYHLKNPALSLLIGDSNFTAGTMTVTDIGTGTPSKPIRLHVQDSGNINGVIGAVQAATQDGTLVESRMVGATSSKALEQFYGTKLLQTYWSNARAAAVAPPQPSTAPTLPAGKPVPKPIKPEAAAKPAA